MEPKITDKDYTIKFADQDDLDGLEKLIVRELEGTHLPEVAGTLKATLMADWKDASKRPEEQILMALHEGHPEAALLVKEDHDILVINNLAGNIDGVGFRALLTSVTEQADSKNRIIVREVSAYHVEEIKLFAEFGFVAKEDSEGKEGAKPEIQRFEREPQALAPHA